MIDLNNNFFIKNLSSWGPMIILFISVLNEFDFNYLGFDFFSFNFSYILIFFWSLKKISHFGYGMICIAGIVNDVVLGLPIGISSLSFVLLCVASSYLRSITLRPHIIKDWFFFLATISVINSLSYLILSVFFLINLEYFDLVINTLFTFMAYYIFAYLFTVYHKIFIGNLNA
tara:strand:- start:1159 stop:1677 length:519 start_codon:yes stop_codon:yes gene_type:complete